MSAYFLTSRRSSLSFSTIARSKIKSYTDCFFTTKLLTSQLLAVDYLRKRFEAREVFKSLQHVFRDARVWVVVNSSVVLEQIEHCSRVTTLNCLFHQVVQVRAIQQVVMPHEVRYYSLHQMLKVFLRRGAS